MTLPAKRQRQPAKPKRAPTIYARHKVSVVMPDPHGGANNTVLYQGTEMHKTRDAALREGIDAALREGIIVVTERKVRRRTRVEYVEIDE